MVVVYNGVKLVHKDEFDKIIDEVESLRKENVALNKDRSALLDIVDGLQKQVYNYQDVIANNLAGVRCKELEGEVKRLKQQVSSLEKITQDADGFGQEGVIKVLKGVIQQQQKELDIRSDEVYNLEVEIDYLEKAFAKLLGRFHGKSDEEKDQQAIIECQKNDIERLVKLNSEQQKALNFKDEILRAFLHDQ